MPVGQAAAAVLGLMRARLPLARALPLPHLVQLPDSRGDDDRGDNLPVGDAPTDECHQAMHDVLHEILRLVSGG